MNAQIYILLNIKQPELSLLEKGGIYLLIVAALGLYGLLMKKKMDADRNRQMKR